MNYLSRSWQRTQDLVNGTGSIFKLTQHSNTLAEVESNLLLANAFLILA